MARMRTTPAPGATRSMSPPAARARLLAPTRAWSPEVSQNCVRVRSTTKPSGPRRADLSRAVSSSPALVMSISSGAVRTGTPLITSTGNLTSGIGADLFTRGQHGGDRSARSRDLPPDHQQGDVIAGRLAADQVAHDRGADGFRRLRHDG